MATTGATHIAMVVTASLCATVCLVLAVLFSIIIVKSHCCDRQYSRKQRIFLYLLLASLAHIYTDVWNTLVANYIHAFVYPLHYFVFCWAALYICYDVFAALDSRDFRVRHGFIEIVKDVFFLVVVIGASLGYAAFRLLVPTHGHPDRYRLLRKDNTLRKVSPFIPDIVLNVIVVVSTVLVLVTLCIACRRIRSQEVVNRLKRAITETVVLLGIFIGDFAVICVWCGLQWTKVLDKETHFFLVETVLIIVHDTIITCGFVVFFGWKMLQHLGRRCCCRRYRRHRGYGEIPGQEERGVLSVQTGIPSTARTYYTCDDVASVTYDTCDESQPPEWFQAVSVLNPTVQ